MTQFKPIFRIKNLLQLNYAFYKSKYFFFIKNLVLIESLKILSVKNHSHSGLV